METSERRHVPVSRRDNPVTSFEAEASINSGGSRQTHIHRVLTIVRQSPGLTTGQVGEVSGLGQMETRKRLSDLKNTGLIRQGVPRVWEGSGRRQVTWWPVIEPVQGVLWQGVNH
jgi:hypothetical protein